jgi:hypothetical protein
MNCPHCATNSCKVVWTRVCCVVRHLSDSPRDARQMHYARLIAAEGREFVNEVVAGVNANLHARREKLKAEE